MLRARSVLLIGGLAVLAALSATACGGGDDGGDAKRASATSSTSTTVASTTTTSTINPSTGGGSGSSGSQSGGGGTTTPTPTITSFQTPGDIDCHNGDLQMFTASWATANATKVTISIDGPGVYKTYDGPNGSDSFPFNCSSSHTFLLTAYGADGRTATQSVTLQPRNVQSAATSTSAP